MNKQQIELLKEITAAAWADINVPVKMYEQLVELLQSAIDDEELTGFLENIRIDKH